MVIPDDDKVLQASWNTLKSLGAITIYPGHGPIWRLDTGKRAE
jgi:hypothetical protein